MAETHRSIGIVVIGRNEAQCLERALESALAQCPRVVYVDSASNDGSPEIAVRLGVEVLRLDPALPMSAARARNAGLAALLQNSPELQLVQFIDGDCELCAGWLSSAVQFFEDSKVAVLCGRVRERHADASLYNRICDLEWDTPIGVIDSCGGIALICAQRLQEIGGFNPALIAGEEPEMCARLRQRGYRVLRIAQPMVLHDARIVAFRQWWKRAVRSGYGGLDVYYRTSRACFSREVHSARLWAGALPLLAIGGAIAAFVFAGLHWAAPIVASAIACFGVQALRIALRGRRRGLGIAQALAYGALLIAGKFAQLTGQLRYARDRIFDHNPYIIEYKGAPPSEPELKPTAARTSAPA